MISHCDTCGSQVVWSWTEAFEKFGFGDGDGLIETWQVEDVLTAAGYEVNVEGWGFHNTVIVSIKKDGTEQIPYDRPGFTFGYDDPRSYLPPEIVTLLDEHFPDEDGAAP